MRIRLYLPYSLLFVLFIIGNFANAQQTTIITGSIVDEKTKDALPYASITLLIDGKPQAVMSDANGSFKAESTAKFTQIKASYFGYEDNVLDIRRGQKQQITIALKPISNLLEGAVVKAKKKRYRNKNNPAVDLIKNAIAHKSENRIEAFDYYQNQKYEKMEIGLCDLSDSIKKSFFFRKLPVLLSYIDTSKVTGRVTLPLFIRETISDQYYRKSPEALKEIVQANKQVDFSSYLPTELVNTFLEGFAGETNIYDNNIMLLNNSFLSPLSPTSPLFYQFHITDTVDVRGTSCIELSLYPKVASDFGFKGFLYITNDSTYAVKKVDLSFAHSNQANFVNDFKLIQEFELIDSTWCLVKDVTAMDFGLTKGRSYLLGTRTTSYIDYVFNQPQSEATYKGINIVVNASGYDERDDEYWNAARHEPLNKKELGIYSLIDTLQTKRNFAIGMQLINVATSGYLPAKKIDIGPIGSLASYNEVEGVRLRFGMKTNALLHPKIFASAYIAYGFRDEKIKYNGTLTYSFVKRKQHQWEYPQHMLTASYTYDSSIPGPPNWEAANDMFILSFNRGRTNRMVYNRHGELSYINELGGGFSINPSVSFWQQQPAGVLVYRTPAGTLISKFDVAQVSLSLRFAPNERFYQNQAKRRNANHSNPIFSLSHTASFKAIAGSDYSVQHTELSIQKRTFLSSLGRLDVTLNAGHVWGTAPFPLLAVHKANQNWNFSLYSYNMMNFMEFVSDSYASVQASHNFNGLILNRLPLVKKLKWRELISVKALWGRLSDKNNPTISTDSDRIFSFNDTDGIQRTFSLRPSEPYVEAGVAIDNILKVLRVDYVWRFSYKGNPDIPNRWWEGVRFRIHVTF